MRATALDTRRFIAEETFTTSLRPVVRERMPNRGVRSIEKLLPGWDWIRQERVTVR